MDLTDDNFKIIAQYLLNTMSPDPNVRRPAEKFLQSVETQPNYSILLLHLVGKEEIDANIRIAGSITFKNFVKRNWNAHADADYQPNRIPEADREAIKSNILALMLKSTPAIEKQLSDAVSIIGRYDFPAKWPQLIGEMVAKFSSGDIHMINGILQAAHSIFKRYRYEFKSQTLWEEIKFVLDNFAHPLTDLLIATMELPAKWAGNADALRVIYSSLGLISKVFYSLNAQDLPEFFEDNMATWMDAFHTLLTSDVPCLATDGDEETGIVELVQSQICDNLCMYAHKYDEEFGAYMQQFVTDVWGLLVKTGQQTKYDALVSNALKFLSTVANRSHYRQLFEDPSVLSNICEKVIIPNMDFRTSDEELFEDSPEEYIRRDIEGSDIETRRRAACDLVKTLSQNFEEKIVQIFGQYLQVLLARFAENPAANWRAKDTAIYMVTSLASRGGTQKHGITKTSELVPLPQFCAQHIVPELERTDVNELPVLRADALKFIMTFRSVLGADTVRACVPLLVRHLQAQCVVVHSYAASTFERVLCVKASKDPASALLVDKAHLSGAALDILAGLFGALRPDQQNEYVMKAIMRALATLEELSMPYMGEALPKLTDILKLVAKCPSRPNFNHFLFESLAVSIKIVCAAQPQAVSSFELALFPVFQDILQQDVLEFMPYVFQMLALLLETREASADGIPEPYWALFPCLLAPALWDRSGNVTPLIRLLCAFIRMDSAQIAAQDKLNAVLGVFQKMIASRANDLDGFVLVQHLLAFYARDALQPVIRQVFSLLFQRLTLSKTAKYVRGFIGFLCFYAAKVGGAELVQIVDNIQPQMFGMVIERVLLPDFGKVTGEREKKTAIIGLTRVLCECPAMLQAPYRGYWPRLLQAIVELQENPQDANAVDLDLGAGDGSIAAGGEDDGYQAAFSQLSFAQPKHNDLLADMPDGVRAMLACLATFVRAHPAELERLVQEGPVNAQTLKALQGYSVKFGVQIF